MTGILNFSFGFLQRMPIYALPFALIFIESIVRRAANEPYAFSILAPAIVSAGLGLCASLAINDLPQVAFAALTAARQTVLRCCSVVGYLLLFFGLCLWLEIVLELMQKQSISSLPVLIVRPLFWDDWGLPLSYALGFYTVCLFANEIKAEVGS